MLNVPIPESKQAFLTKLSADLKKLQNYEGVLPNNTCALIRDNLEYLEEAYTETSQIIKASQENGIPIDEILMEQHKMVLQMRKLYHEYVENRLEFLKGFIGSILGVSEEPVDEK